MPISKFSKSHHHSPFCRALFAIDIPAPPPLTVVVSAGKTPPMKTCTYCGKQYPDDASICAVDGQPPPSRRPRAHCADDPAAARFCPSANHRRRAPLKLLSIFHFVVAGPDALLRPRLPVPALLDNEHRLRQSRNVEKKPQWLTAVPPDFFKIFIVFYILIGGVIIVAGSPESPRRHVPSPKKKPHLPASSLPVSTASKSPSAPSSASLPSLSSSAIPSAKSYARS